MKPVSKKNYWGALFESSEQQKKIKKSGIETIHGDLLDTKFIEQSSYR